MVSVLGFSLLRQRPERGARLRYRSSRGTSAKGAEHSAQTPRRARLRRARGAFAMRSSSRSCRRRFPSSAPPPASRSASRTAAATATRALVAARNQLLGMAAQSKVLAGVRPDGLEDAPQLFIDIDRDRASALGVSFDNINAVAVDRARLDLRQRLPERRPAAARHRPGRCARPHAARRPDAAQRRSATRASRCRWRRWRRRAGSPGRSRPSASTAIRRCGSRATPRRAIRPATRWTRWSAWPASFPPASPSSGPASRARSACRARRR